MANSNTVIFGNSIKTADAKNASAVFSYGSNQPTGQGQLIGIQLESELQPERFRSRK
jgi:hypothetical protein